MNKKLISVMVALLLILTALAGCSIRIEIVGKKTQAGEVSDASDKATEPAESGTTSVETTEPAASSTSPVETAEPTPSGTTPGEIKEPAEKERTIKARGILSTSPEGYMYNLFGMIR